VNSGSENRRKQLNVGEHVLKPDSNNMRQTEQSTSCIDMRAKRVLFKFKEIACYRTDNSVILSRRLRDPAVESERFRRDMKTHLFAGH